jgi:hypothetical protein
MVKLLELDAMYYLIRWSTKRNVLNDHQVSDESFFDIDRALYHWA